MASTARAPLPASAEPNQSSSRSSARRQRPARGKAVEAQRGAKSAKSRPESAAERSWRARRAGAGHASDRPCGAQPRDPRVVAAQLAQDGVGVLAERRHRIHPRRRLGRQPGRQRRAHRARGVPTSAQRRRAASCGCAHTSCMSFSRALAICAASRRSTTCVGGQRRERRDDRWRAAPRAPRCAASSTRSARRSPAPAARSTSRAEGRPLALVLQAQHHDLAVAGGKRPVGVDGRVRGARARRRRRAVVGVVQRIAHPLDHALQHRHVDARRRGRSARAAAARRGCCCTRTCRRRCRRSSSRPSPARRASR